MELIVLQSVSTVRDSMARERPDLPQPVVYYFINLLSDMPYGLREMEVDGVLYREQLLRMHTDQNSEALTVAVIPKTSEYLDSWRPVVYTDCNEVSCDCRRDYPWLGQASELTKW